MTKQDIIDLVKDAGYGFLATSDGAQPKVRPMAPYLTDDGRLLLALVPNARSAQQVKKNPLVEICYVDRRMSFCRLSGKAKITDHKANKETLWNNVPSLRQYFSGPEDKNFTLMEIDIIAAEAMTQSHQTPEKIDF